MPTHKKIFIIEDEANILYALQAKFSVEGFNVNIDNGTGETEEILNKIRTFKPDFVVLDLVLPKMNGKEILRLIRADENLHNPCVFAFSNFSEEDAKTREKVGIDYFLTKDEFIVDDFVTKVKKIIENRAKINK